MQKYKELHNLFRVGRPITTSEVTAMGIPTQALVDFCRKGYIQRITRGVYVTANTPATDKSDYEIISTAIPHGIICLVSALRFHNITIENPHELHIALKQHSRYPKIAYPPVVFYIYSDQSYSFGIESHNCNGVIVKVYSIEKTIADCFKYRNKIGLEVAVAVYCPPIRRRAKFRRKSEDERCQTGLGQRKKNCRSF